MLNRHADVWTKGMGVQPDVIADALAGGESSLKHVSNLLLKMFKSEAFGTTGTGEKACYVWKLINPVDNNEVFVKVGISQYHWGVGSKVAV